MCKIIKLNKGFARNLIKTNRNINLIKKDIKNHQKRNNAN